MLRIPVKIGVLHKNLWIRTKSSSTSIRSTFIEYFVENHRHKHVKSSSVVPLCDPTVPFVNAGMNQFKGVFLGTVDPPYPRVVNSQKCIRVGGKHNDLDVVGTDGTHHTFFEMLGNWSFGDYYKKEACRMAWDLLLGPYRLKPENLIVTYFAGDVVLGLQEDRECRDIWKEIGVPSDRLKALGSKENFWEMGLTGPCGPCTEIHYVNPDGSLTEIWNIVFIQCNREADGKVKQLDRFHVDTGMGLERMAALLQNKRSNYDTDLFLPIIKAIERNSKGVNPYGGSYEKDAVLDIAYRRLADHARMITVSLADSVFPAASLNLKQIMRKSFKISSDMFGNPKLLTQLYPEVAATLGATYPELISKEKDSRLIIEHEEQSYAKLRGQMMKKWRQLVSKYPEVESMADVELAGFAQGYTEFKETMKKQKSAIIPGELVFKLYDTHGFQEDVINRVAELNHLTIDKEGFWKLLSQHKSRHKTAFKEQTSNKGLLFNKAIEKLIKNGIKSTNDQHKYMYKVIDNKVQFEPLKTKVVAILDETCEWIDYSDPCKNRTYYVVTEDTNFYCEEGGQIADTGVIEFKQSVMLKVDSVFKIRDFVFHKGSFLLSNDSDNYYVKNNSDVLLSIDSERRVRIMQNHTGVHLLNAAIRKVLPSSVVCQIGSSVTDKGFSLNLSVYGQKLSQEVILKAQDLIRESIKANAPVTTEVIDSMQLSREESILTVPGETYPERGLRVVAISQPLPSKELCCGSHAPCTGAVRGLCVSRVRAANTNTPHVYGLAGAAALQAQELFCRAEKLQQVIHLVEPSRCSEEVSAVRHALAELCEGGGGEGGGGGAPYGQYKQCVELLDSLANCSAGTYDIALLQSAAETEVREAVAEGARAGRPFVVHFLRCSYLMQECGVRGALAASDVTLPALVLGCAGGVIVAATTLPQEYVSSKFTAEQWLNSILPVFQADMVPSKPGQSPLLYAEMTATKVSLINCEQLVADAMRVALHFAKSRTQRTGADSVDTQRTADSVDTQRTADCADNHAHADPPTQNRHHN